MTVKSCKKRINERQSFHAIVIRWVTLMLVSCLLKHRVTTGPLKLCYVCVSVFTKRRGPPPEFQWLHKYAPGAGVQRNSGNSWPGMDNPTSDTSESGVEGLMGQDDSLTDVVSATNAQSQMMVIYITKIKICIIT